MIRVPHRRRFEVLDVMLKSLVQIKPVFFNLLSKVICKCIADVETLIWCGHDGVSVRGKPVIERKACSWPEEMST